MEMSFNPDPSKRAESCLAKKPIGHQILPEFLMRQI